MLAILIVITALAGSVARAQDAWIVDVPQNFVMGGVDNGTFLAASNLVMGAAEGRSFGMFSLTQRVGDAVAGPADVMSPDVCPETLSLDLKGDDTVRFAVSAPWNPMPRVPRIASPTQPVYLQAVGQFLKGRGIANPNVRIEQLLRVDLDGDGEDEVMIAATQYFLKEGEGVPADAPRGSYSCVLLRQLMGNVVKTQMLEGEFYPEGGTFNAPARYEVRGVFDADGDGRMEVLVGATYYEGAWSVLYRASGRGVTELLRAGCGL